MEGLILDLMREGIMTLIKCAAPTLLVALCVGLTVSIFQTATSIQEQTLAFIPKIIGVFLAIIIFGSWIINLLTTFMIRIMSSFNTFL